ncbi:galactose-3-O-sulfotransferase 2 [Caerostris extrusa]|uniref:Galactose-3-O-sulfotransferase 2 n=1 Tax=Caerostris extrusa TaxID=172846 RepID=A0AAV4R9A8_CAEEX|nr:galactose-3-O-sulfotransferase 2 [Caerostris extrusa]
MNRIRYLEFHRKALFALYAFSFCTLIIYLTGFSPRSHFYGMIGWSQSQMAMSSVKTIPCLSRMNIVFLKTHKCASTSVQNILMRYAHQQNLTIAVPIFPKNHYFSLTQPFRKEMIAGAPWENLGYNILCHHMVFNKAVIEKIMPKDSIYISIIRNPVSLFESLYEYDELQDFYHMDIEEYAKGTKNSSTATKLKNRSNGMGRNQMLFDFGVHPAFFNNRAMIIRAIENIERNFDFIMVAEYFDESIILLKHILCWELDDVISLTINARMKNYKKNLSDEAVKNLEEWNWGDKMLYEYFLAKFHKTMDEFGREQLKIEVEELQRRRNDWFDYCIQKKVEAKNLTSYNIWSNKVAGYILKPNIDNVTCEDLVKPEKYFTSEIRQHQLIQSLSKGATFPNYGPLSFRRLIDLKFLKGKDQAVARSMLTNQYKFRRRKNPIIKNDVLKQKQT